jgi:hypothetical protein
MSYHRSDDCAAALKAAAKAVREGTFQKRAGARAEALDLYALLGDGAFESIPTGQMPSWMLRLLFSLGRGLDRSHWPKFLDGVAWAGSQWQRLDEAAWDRVRLEFQHGAIDQALTFAAPLQPDPAPRYWREVEPLARAVLAALGGDGDLHAAADAMECWSIPEGYDLWEQDNATYEAMWAAKCLADAAYCGGDRGDWTESGMAGDVSRADSTAVPTLCRILLQALSNAVSAAMWG